METKAKDRFEKLPARRLMEIVIYIVISLALLIVGLRLENTNYSLFFYMMAAFFFLAIFRPRVLP